jgi:hypothetical protein
MGYRYNRQPQKKKPISHEVEDEEAKSPQGLYQYTDFGKRTLAYAIDALLFIIPIGFIFGTRYPEGNANILVPVGYISAIILFLYFTILTYYNNGQTFGQYLTKMRVMPQEVMNPDRMKSDMPKITFKQSLIHSLGKMHPIITFIDVIFGFAMRKGEQMPTRITQGFAETVVVELMDIAKTRLEKSIGK